MKKNLICVVLLLAMLAVSGCGGREESSAPAEAPGTAEATTLPAEEISLVDDSLSFEFDPEDVLGGMNCFLQEQYPGLLEEYFDDFRYVDSLMINNGLGEVITGWVCFTGTPRAETGWQQTELNGEPVYCRSVNLRRESGTRWVAERSFPMEPLQQLIRYELIEGSGFGDFQQAEYERRVQGLRSARLYVSDLGESYTLTEPTALRALETALTPIEGENPLNGLPAGCTHSDPIYLDFTDGSSALALIAGDGSNAVSLWDGVWEICNSNLSIYELFGVERQAAGYSRDAGGLTTTVITTNDYQSYGWDHEPVVLSRECVYDQNGCRVEERRSIVSADPRDWDRIAALDYRGEYEFDSQGRQTVKRDYQDNTLVETSTFAYDAGGLLIKWNISFPDGGGCFYTYDYDDQGRLTAIIYHFADGREGRANHFYWYDENGGRHEYAQDESGSPITDDGQPIRRG